MTTASGCSPRGHRIVCIEGALQRLTPEWLSITLSFGDQTMIRRLSLAAAFALALALPASAEDAKTKVEPGTSSTMSNQAPSMRPSDAMAGPSDEKSAAGTGMALTLQEGESWIRKPVYSKDGKKVGEVVSFQRDEANNVIGMRADIGGYFGFGRSRVNLVPAQFKLQGDRVELDLTAAEVKALPIVHI
jgi:hypothetical protein